MNFSQKYMGSFFGGGGHPVKSFPQYTYRKINLMHFLNNLVLNALLVILFPIDINSKNTFDAFLWDDF